MNKYCIKSPFSRVCELIIGHRHKIQIQYRDVTSILDICHEYIFFILYLFFIFFFGGGGGLVDLNAKDMNYNTMKSPWVRLVSGIAVTGDWIISVLL